MLAALSADKGDVRFEALKTGHSWPLTRAEAPWRPQH
jgi:hypothetical protein